MLTKSLIAVVGLITVVATLGAGSLGSTLFEQFGTRPRVIHDCSSRSIRIPVGATLQDYENSATNFVTGSNLPTSIVDVSHGGRVTATLTGLVKPGTGERRVSVSVHDEETNLVRARVYVNGALVATATVENGGIALCEGTALASLSFLIPPGGQEISVEVRREGVDGKTASDSFSADYGWASKWRVGEMQVRRWLCKAVLNWSTP